MLKLLEIPIQIFVELYRGSHFQIFTFIIAKNYFKMFELSFQGPSKKFFRANLGLKNQRIYAIQKYRK